MVYKSVIYVNTIMGGSLFTFDKRMVLYHFIAWITYTALLFLINGLTDPSVRFGSLLMLSLLFAFIFYCTLWIFLVFYRARRYLMTVLAFLIYSVLIYWVGYWYIFSLVPKMNFIVYFKERPILEKEYLQHTILALTRFSVYSFTYYMVGIVKVRSQVFLSVTEEVHQKDIELLKARNKVLQYEIELLTAQVNPHYIHNKINMLYGRLLETAPEEAERVLELNDIVMYMMTPSLKGSGWVLIEKEIENLYHAMNLDLSKEERQHVIFSIHGEMQPHLIPYMTLLILFDNIIKYAVVNDAAHPVRMDLYLEEDHLHFSGQNKIKKKVGRTTTSHGTGLGNLKRRLDIGFPEHHQFSTQVADDYFMVNLSISY